MKIKLLLFIFIFSLISVSVFGQVVSWNFNTSMPGANYAVNLTNQQSVLINNLTNATVSDITLSSAVGATANTYHRSSNWGSTFTATDYLEFSITASSGYYFPNSEVIMNLTYAISNPAIGNLRINYAWGSNSFSQAGSDVLGFTNNSMSALTPFTIPAPGNTTSTKLTIRIHGWVTYPNNRERTLLFGDVQIAGNSPLPVTLNGFCHSVSKNDVTLRWSTSKEENNAGFSVERKSEDTENWTSIAFVKGRGNSNTTVNYSYTDKNLQTGKYEYRLKQTDYNGNYQFYYLSGTADIGNPGRFALSQNYPNPFNPVTRIDFEIPEEGYVTLKVFDITGREILTLVNENRKAGYHKAIFDGSKLTTGVYFYKLEAKDFTRVMRMILIK